MFNGPIIQQGSFTADGNDKILKIRSDVDWMMIYNYTQWADINNGYGYKYYWQSGMGTTGLMEYHPAGDHTAAVNTSATTFTTINSATYAGGAWIAVTAGTNATQPVYSTGATTGLYAGGIVRLKGMDQTELNGVDFSVDAVTLNTEFRLANTLATAPGVIAGAAGYYKLIAPNIEIYELFKPATRHISNISAAAAAVVTTLVDHGYSVGEKVRFSVGSDFGMTQINNLVGEISAVTASTFTIDIDTTGFTAFKFPTAAEFTAAGALTYASVVPIGITTSSTYADYSTDATLNQGFVGMILKGGTTGPGGNAADAVYWIAGKSDRIDNE